MFPLESNQKYEIIELQEILILRYLSPPDVFNKDVLRSPCFPHKLLQDVFSLDDVFVADNSAYSSMNRRTERNFIEKLLLWMWLVLFRKNNGDDI